MAQVSITCREFVDFLMAYLNGELPAQKQATFEAHLERCRSCATYLVAYRETTRLGKQALARDAAEIPAEVPEDLVTAVTRALRNASGSRE